MAIGKRLRYEVLCRDGNACRYCGTSGTPTNPLVVDHVLPRVLGGSDHPSNLATACTDCNSGKTSSLPAGLSMHDLQAEGREGALYMASVAWRRVAELEAALQEYAGTASEVALQAGRLALARQILASGIDEDLLEEAKVRAQGDARPDLRDEVKEALHLVDILSADRWSLNVAASNVMQAIPDSMRGVVVAATDESLEFYGGSDSFNSVDILTTQLEHLAAQLDLMYFSHLPAETQDEWMRHTRRSLYGSPRAQDDDQVRRDAAENSRRYKRHGVVHRRMCQGPGKAGAACVQVNTWRCYFTDCPRCAEEECRGHLLCEWHTQAADGGALEIFGATVRLLSFDEAPEEPF